MKISQITERAKHAKAKDKKPKLNKPNKGHQSPHPMQGKMVGEMYGQKEIADITANLNKNKKAYFNMQMFIKYAMALPGVTQLSDLQKPEIFDKVIATMQQDGIDVMEGENLNALKNAFKNANFGDKAVMAGATATLIALLGLGNLSSMKDSPLGKELAVAAQQGDMVAAYHLKNLDFYADQDMVRTIQNLKIAYIDDANREDVNAFLSDPKRFPDLKKVKNESKINEAYSGTKSALVSAVMTDLEKKANDEEGVDFLRRLASLIGKKIIKRDNGSLLLENKIPFTQCPKCGGSIVHESQLNEKQDACYHKVKSRYKVWPSAYASGALVKCRKVGAKNWGNSSKKKKKKSKK